MKKIGIFYGSSTGYTADAAIRIAKALGVDTADVYDVADTVPSKLGDYETIILGSSTWGDGDMETDMEEFIDGAGALDLKGHRMAFFGCGDETMADTFCNAVGKMYTSMLDTGAEMIAPFNAEGYTFNHSDAEIDGKYVGLVLDDVNHDDITDQRIAEWASLIK